MSHNKFCKPSSSTDEIRCQRSTKRNKSGRRRSVMIKELERIKIFNETQARIMPPTTRNLRRT